MKYLKKKIILKLMLLKKRMENYAANFIKVNTLNQMNNIKEDKNLVK